MSDQKVAIITGSSSGIGKATAILFAKHNYKLSLSGRNAEELEKVAKECMQTGGLSKENVSAAIHTPSVTSIKCHNLGDCNGWRPDRGVYCSGASQTHHCQIWPSRRVGERSRHSGQVCNILLTLLSVECEHSSRSAVLLRTAHFPTTTSNSTSM